MDFQGRIWDKGVGGEGRVGSGTVDDGEADCRGALESRRVEEEERANVDEEEEAIDECLTHSKYSHTRRR